MTAKTAAAVASREESMRRLFATTFVIVLAVAASALPAAAQQTQTKKKQPKQTQVQQTTRPAGGSRSQWPLPALNTKLPNTVHEGGHKYLGRDPDPVVRSQMMRDEAMHKGNSY
jgi:hypothetical protein